MPRIAITFLTACVCLLLLPSSLPDKHWLWLFIPAVALLFTQYKLSAVFLLGGLWTLLMAGHVLDERLDTNLEGKDLIITGQISSVPEKSKSRIRFNFQADQIVGSGKNIPSQIRLNWYKPLPDEIHAGEKWQLKVRLKRPYGMMNPGGFDYENWLFQQHIGATGYIRSSDDNKRIESAPNSSINALRQSLLETINTALPSSSYLGLIQGLTTGIRTNISPKQWQVLRQTGTSHLLAISGLHIGLAAGLGFFLFRWVWSVRAKNLLILAAREAGAIASFIFASFYAALAGFSIPTQRALLMVGIALLALLFRRTLSANNIISISLLLVLLFDPLSVLSIGFWLSFSAVIIILFTSQHRFPAPRWQWAKIHTIIAFGLSPLLLLFFLEASLIAPFANLIAVPVISLIIVPLLLFACFFLWCLPTLGIWLLQLADILLGWLWPLLQELSELSFAQWTHATIPIAYWFPIGIGMLLLLSPRGFPGRWLGIIGLMPLFFINPSRPENNEYWFTLLDVGQGLSAVIQTRKHTLVFDTGPRFSDSFNTGTAVILPFLQSQGIKQVDMLIVSHGDNDHIGGAMPLINSFPVLQILSSEEEQFAVNNSQLCRAGQKWQWDGIDFKILHPSIHDMGSENNLSCVLQIKNQGGVILLTGDIEKQAESQLIQRYGKLLKSNILVAPHHGSKTSSSKTFISQVNPDIVLFPVGYRNRYHFPDKTIVSSYKNSASTLLNSAQHGAIKLQVSTQGILPPIIWRKQAQRIWTSETTE